MNAFEEFQREEYGKIAEAHFKTIESISAFFRYYLLLMALPLALVGAFITVAGRSSGEDELGKQLITSAKGSAGLVFLVIGVIGLFIMVYVVHLRFDALLYAKTVNAIRKFFYDRAEVGFLQKTRMRVLPQTVFAPPYYEEEIFLPVVIVFAVLNTLYVYLGSILIVDHTTELLPGNALFRPPLIAITASMVFLIIHIVVYRRDAGRREASYLRRGAIGIDIDGVLNLHRQHFAEILKAKGGPTIDPDAIVFLPVRDSPSLGVTRAQEIDVFNSPKYWTEMIADPEASHYVNALREMGLRIHLVTNRPWPDLRRLDPEQRRGVRRAWSSEVRQVAGDSLGAVGAWLRLKCGWPIRWPAIEVFTRSWLRKHGILFDSLTIERSLSSDGVHHSVSTRSRVQVAQRRALKFFVEDDWESAYRLAFICDVVFLIRHPYNQAINLRRDLFGKRPFTEKLPDNVIVVDSWMEIYRAVKQLI